MKYCERCGAELSEEVQFCANCGTPVENARKKRKKGILSAIFAGVIVVAAGTVGLLFGTGILGDNRTAETSVIDNNRGGGENGEKAVQSTKMEETAAPDAEATKSELAERAWTAYSAYVEKLRPALDSYQQYLYDTEDASDYESWDGSEYDFPADRCNDYFALFYLDEDDYPELLCGTVNPVLLTYKNGSVIFAYYSGEDTGEEEMDGENTAYMSFPLNVNSGFGISCKERQNSLYVWEVFAAGGGFNYDYFYSLDENDYQLKTVWNGVAENLTEEEYIKEFEEQKGDDYSWTLLTEDGEKNDTGGETIFEAWYSFADRNHLFAN